MDRRVFRQALDQVSRSLIVLGLGAAAFYYVLLFQSASFTARPGFAAFLREPPRAVEALVGGSVDLLQPSGWVVTGMTHPIMLALLTASALVIASGAVAAEVERGSIDLVLTRPVGRTSFLTAKAAAAVVAVTMVETMGFLSALVARATVENVDRVPIAGLARSFAGSWVLFVAIAMVALLISVRSSIRGHAIGLSSGFVIVSFFINFTALLVDELHPLRFVSAFHYFKPSDIIGGQGLGGLVTLAALAAGALAASLTLFSRQDITR